MNDLERRLRELGGALAYPEGTGIARRVRARLASERARRRRLRRAVLLAAALALLAGGAALAVRFALPGVEIVPSPRPPVSPAPPGQGLGLGAEVTLDEAASRVSFPVETPRALGAPAGVYLDRTTPGGRVSLVYEPAAGLPQDGRTGYGALLTAFRGRPNEEILLTKLPKSGTRVERVTVRGSDGFWLTGEPHIVYYVDENGEFLDDTVRLAGNVLLWTDEGVTYRLEAKVSRAEAIRIAASVR